MTPRLADALQGSAPLRSTRDGTLAELAYQRIKEDVVTCRLPPGTVVTEGELSERYGLGRSPVRDGLRRLEQDRLVRIHPRHGCVVAPINLKEVSDVFALRLILETESASLAAGKVGVATIRRLQELCSVSYDPTDPKSVALFLRCNTEFHATVARSSGNERLAEIVSSLLDNMERLFHAGLKVENHGHSIGHEHTELLEALLAGDSPRARRITADQIHKAQRMVTYGLMADPSLLNFTLLGEAGG